MPNIALTKLIVLFLFGCHHLSRNFVNAVPLTVVEQEALWNVRAGFIGFPANWLNTTLANPCGRWTGIGCNAAGVFNRIQLTGKVRI